MTVWFTADQHFGHANIIKHCARPFANVVEMDEEIIRRHNDLVHPNDTVWHLGDFAWDFRRVRSILSRLYGHHFLVGGNHEKLHTDARVASYGESCRNYGFEVVVASSKMDLDGNGNWDTLLVHMPPVEFSPGDTRYAADHVSIDAAKRVLCGHVHEKWMRNGPCLNVGVDQWDFAPVDLDTVRKEFAEGIT